MNKFFYGIYNPRMRGVFFTARDALQIADVLQIDRKCVRKFKTLGGASHFAQYGLTTTQPISPTTQTTSSTTLHESIAPKRMSDKSNVNTECMPDNMDPVEIFVDGSFSKNKAGYAVWFGDNHPHNFSAAVPKNDKRTSQTAELYAMIHAIQTIYKYYPDRPVTICSDSSYVCGAVKNVRAWKRAGWKNTAGDVKNMHLIEPLHDLVADPRFKRVKVEHLYTTYGVHSHPPPTNKKSVGYKKWECLDKADQMAKQHTV